MYEIRTWYKYLVHEIYQSEMTGVDVLCIVRFLGQVD